MSGISPDQSDYFNETAATFGDRLQAAREAKGLTINGLAEKIAGDPQEIENWENDTDSPRANHIQMLAGLLNVSIVWLMSGEGNGTNQVEKTYGRPEGVNDALGEISQLQTTLSAALEKLENLEKRLQAID